ncbi:MAG: 23S rRNA (adenine(2503)-C(2))-methyltransferase RlmN [Rickettsiales bacterium]|nr:23S rRNA (adenine(2503)-C(2))-methyltransferase RlmN [Rickettsiales bacterium]
MKQNIFDLTLEELENILVNEYHTRPFVAKQVWSWLYTRGSRDFETMSDVSRDLRGEMSRRYSCDRPSLAGDLLSEDGTRKWLLELTDGQRIEVVYIPWDDRGTLCLSSQVGCAMGCKFCNTGDQGFIRNLETFEIVQQVILAKDLLNEWGNRAIGEGRKITNIVLMGMGEPLLNYERVMKSMGIVNDRNGIAFSNRRITLSTCGIVPKIYDFRSDMRFNLAISLHAATNELRKKIMPIAEAYSLEQLMEACSHYSRETGHRRVTFEYIMILDFNDRAEDAGRLIGLVRKYHISAKFNLIPFNRWESCKLECQPSTPDRIRKFAKYITSAGYPCPVRLSRGQDIMAACGQLRSKPGSTVPPTSTEGLYSGAETVTLDS